MKKNVYLCTVKNASERLKSALNAKSRRFGAAKMIIKQIKNKKWIRHLTTTEF